jgi:hypothetical protein
MRTCIVSLAAVLFVAASARAHHDAEYVTTAKKDCGWACMNDKPCAASCNSCLDRPGRHFHSRKKPAVCHPVGTDTLTVADFITRTASGRVYLLGENHYVTADTPVTDRIIDGVMKRLKPGGKLVFYIEHFTGEEGDVSFFPGGGKDVVAATGAKTFKITQYMPTYPKPRKMALSDLAKDSGLKREMGAEGDTRKIKMILTLATTKGYDVYGFDMPGAPRLSSRPQSGELEKHGRIMPLWLAGRDYWMARVIDGFLRDPAHVKDVLIAIIGADHTPGILTGASKFGSLEGFTGVSKRDEIISVIYFGNEDREKGPKVSDFDPANVKLNFLRKGEFGYDKP